MPYQTPLLLALLSLCQCNSSTIYSMSHQPGSMPGEPHVTTDTPVTQSPKNMTTTNATSGSIQVSVKDPVTTEIPMSSATTSEMTSFFKHLAPAPSTPLPSTASTRTGNMQLSTQSNSSQTPSETQTQNTVIITFYQETTQIFATSEDTTKDAVESLGKTIAKSQTFFTEAQSPASPNNDFWKTSAAHGSHSSRMSTEMTADSSSLKRLSQVTSDIEYSRSQNDLSRNTSMPDQPATQPDAGVTEGRWHESTTNLTTPMLKHTNDYTAALFISSTEYIHATKMTTSTLTELAQTSAKPNHFTLATQTIFSPLDNTYSASTKGDHVTHPEGTTEPAPNSTTHDNSSHTNKDFKHHDTHPTQDVPQKVTRSDEKSATSHEATGSATEAPGKINAISQTVFTEVSSPASPNNDYRTSSAAYGTVDSSSLKSLTQVTFDKEYSKTNAVFEKVLPKTELARSPKNIHETPLEGLATHRATERSDGGSNPWDVKKHGSSQVTAGIVGFCVSVFLIILICSGIVLLKKWHHKRKRLDIPDWAGHSPFLHFSDEPETVITDSRQHSGRVILTTMLPRPLSSLLATDEQPAAEDVSMTGITFGKTESSEPVFVTAVSDTDHATAEIMEEVQLCSQSTHLTNGQVTETSTGSTFGQIQEEEPKVQGPYTEV